MDAQQLKKEDPATMLREWVHEVIANASRVFSAQDGSVVIEMTRGSHVRD